ncbi:MAG: GNAT family N-acetyltransferase [Burkholderiaceae bacterium]
MEASTLRIEKFKDISISDAFFDSLKEDYDSFEAWFAGKADKSAFTFRADDGMLDGFLFLKEEAGPVTDVEPNLPSAHRIKIGTFKVNPHGTRLGERFIKRAFDAAVSIGVSALYVTVFEKHDALVQLFERYGFVKVGTKNSSNGREAVYERLLGHTVGDVVLDYPRIPIQKDRHFVLSLYPQWHSRLLPDSLLKTENTSILKDVSHTNSIHKIYLAAMQGVEQLKRGDTLLIYRTAEGGSAYHTSVVTSLCVVEELTHISHYATERQFLDHCKPYSIFDLRELESFYKTKKYPWVIRFTYNLALTKRPNRKALLEVVGLAADTYWGFFKLTTDQLKHILTLSGDYEKARSLVYSS